ncbi:MAG: FAD-dependent oxidoreductase [Paracoccaceae bacterium]
MHLVLVGGGHAHALVLEDFARRGPPQSTRITLVAREAMAPYSGMLPGMIAGRYAAEEAHIDLAPLAKAAGARLVADAAVGLDARARRLSLAGGGTIGFDAISLDVGITPRLDGIEGAARHAVAVKPISTFLPKWRALLDAARRADGPRRIAVAGGGAAGFELALAIRERLLAEVPDPAALGVTLVAGEALLPGLGARARRLGRAALARRGIALVEHDRAAAIESARLTLASGRVLDADAALVTTGARAPGWFADTDLPRDEAGFLAARDTFQLAGLDHVLAVGDCATVAAHPRPKAGVIAVRQGPPLARALRRLAAGEAPEPFAPQSRWLQILTLDRTRAIAAYAGLAAEGAWAMTLKDRIDRRFMARFPRPASLG